MHEVTEYLTWLRDKRGSSPGTIAKYRQTLSTWEGFSDTDLPARSEVDVEAFTGRPRRGGGAAAPATQAYDVAVLGSFYSWAQARLHWPHNPARLAAHPRVHNRQPRPISDQLWLHVWTHEALPDDARVALGLGYFAGLRRAEIVNLRGEQITWGRQIVGFTRKGGGEDTFDYGDVLDHLMWALPSVVVDPAMLEVPLRALARERNQSRLMPWGTHIAPVALNKRLPGWLQACDVDPGDGFTPHMLRHSFATNLLRSGVPLDIACDLCNHSSPTITMRYVRTSGGRLAGLRNTHTTTKAEASWQR